MKFIKHIAAFILPISVALLLFEDGDLFGYTVSELLSVSLLLYFVYRVFVGLGNRVMLLELIAAIAVFEVLFIPTLHYWFDDQSMPILSEDYYAYVLPAVTLFVSCLDYYSRLITNHKIYFDKLRTHLSSDFRTGYILIGIGVVATIASASVSMTYKTLLDLFSSFLFIGTLYVVYSGSRLKVYAIGASVATLIYGSVRAGMFGSLFFWLLLYTVILLAGSKYRLSKPVKLTMLLAGMIAAIVIQSVKTEYRWNTWGRSSDDRRGDYSLLVELLTQRVKYIDELIKPEDLLVYTSRYNQGYFIGQTMSYVPYKEPYANGEIFFDFFVPIVPRFLWSDKPLSNGRANVHRFTPTVLEEGNTVDISPIGEGYANFGVYGGILFTLLYAILLGSVFHASFKIALRTPTILLWLPKLFFTCMTMETSIFAAWGGMFQTIIIVYLFYKISQFLGIEV